MKKDVFKHQPVLLSELKHFLPERGIVIDGTVGMGGHAQLILETSSNIQLIGIDRDPQAIADATLRLAAYKERTKLLVGSYADLSSLITATDWPKITLVLLDLGFSSSQITEAERGFAFSQNGPLDMRYNQADLSLQTAADIINRASRSQLEQILSKYGEEPQAKRLARAICEQRKQQLIKTTFSLKRLVESEIPPFYGQRIHPATKTFQALRIAVNHELEELEYFVRAVVPTLPSQTTVAIISFHSLEDRIVKRGFKQLFKPAADMLGQRLPSQAESLVKKIITPSEVEIAINPRARSAKLRVIKII